MLLLSPAEQVDETDRPEDFTTAINAKLGELQDVKADLGDQDKFISVSFFFYLAAASCTTNALARQVYVYRIIFFVRKCKTRAFFEGGT